MLKVVGIATQKGREESLIKTLASLVHQMDYIHVYDNTSREDLTDNGKFFFLQNYKEPIYYFSCDDDLIYHPTYANTCIEAIEKYKTIVTFHGRILSGLNRNYYTKHQVFHCLKKVQEDIVIDVAGTGVTAFRTDYFNPDNICFSEYKKMSDLVFSLEAWKQKKTITLINHPTGFIIEQPINKRLTIHYQYKNRCQKQIQLANQIFNIKHGL